MNKQLNLAQIRPFNEFFIFKNVQDSANDHSVYFTKLKRILNWCDLQDKLPQDNFADFPLYIDSSREAKITHIQMECSASLRDQYVLSGLAFYLKY